MRTAALLAVLALGACQDNESAMVRGDRLWADSSFTSALAEYRLAAAQGGDEQALIRLAHTLARTGVQDEARSTYERLVAESDAYRDQAVYDFLHLAERGLDRGDAITAASAIDDALALRPELSPRRGVQDVAAVFRDRDEPDKALEYYRRALTTVPPDSTPALLYQIGLLEEERGRCGTAMDYLRAFREHASGDWRRYRTLLSEARWHTGSCAFDLAMAARDSGDVAGALDHLDQMIELGVPENRLDQAWFERGELLLGTAPEEALAAYRKVLERNPSRAGRLVERAQERIDQIRFGTAPGDTVPPGTASGIPPGDGGAIPIPPQRRHP